MKRIFHLLPVAVVAAAFAVAAPARANETVTSCGTASNEVFLHAAVFGINTSNSCPLGIMTGPNDVGAGAAGRWLATAPAGLSIVDAAVKGQTLSLVNDGQQYTAQYIWGPGFANQEGMPNPDTTTPEVDLGTSYGTGGFPSPDFGFQIQCFPGNCTPAGKGATASALEVDFNVAESSGPSLSASGLWGVHKWIRGSWPISVTGDSPSGVCALSVSIDGRAVAQRGFGQDGRAWHQCDAIGAGGLSATIDTSRFPSGRRSLSLAGTDAAGEGSSPGQDVYFDNVTPVVSLTGPADALTTQGTQSVTATAHAGPSGVGGLFCRVDGGRTIFRASRTVVLPVAGLGTHIVTCRAENKAVGTSGYYGISAPRSISVPIRIPTAAAITFANLKDKLRCATVKRIVRHGKPRRVTRRVRRCYARTVKRRVLVVLRRHGKPVRRHGRIVRVHRTRRVAVLPHRVLESTRRIHHGRGTTVSGYLGRADGTPLAGRAVTVYAADDDGLEAFHPVSTATTDASGGWVAKIPAGPSRLLEAAYGGDATTAPALTTTVHLFVPAKIRIVRATPRQVAWGHTVTLKGELSGGHIPRRGVNVRLRIGIGRHYTTYGVKTHVARNGRFTTRFRFGPGEARVHRTYEFRFATLPSNYPFAPASSNTVSVHVGGHPRPRGRHRRHRGRSGSSVRARSAPAHTPAP